MDQGDRDFDHGELTAGSGLEAEDADFDFSTDPFRIDGLVLVPGKGKKLKEVRNAYSRYYSLLDPDGVGVEGYEKDGEATFGINTCVGNECP